jgi:hypothetical protein
MILTVLKLFCAQDLEPTELTALVSQLAKRLDATASGARVGPVLCVTSRLVDNIVEGASHGFRRRCGIPVGPSRSDDEQAPASQSGGGASASSARRSSGWPYFDPADNAGVIGPADADPSSSTGADCVGIAAATADAPSSGTIALYQQLCACVLLKLPARLLAIAPEDAFALLSRSV